MTFHIDESFTFLWFSACKESLHWIWYMSSGSRINPPSIRRNFSKICLRTYKRKIHTFLFKPSPTLAAVFLNMSFLATKVALDSKITFPAFATFSGSIILLWWKFLSFSKFWLLLQIQWVFDEELIILLTISKRVRLRRSATPFCWGVPGIVYWARMPRFSRNLANGPGFCPDSSYLL